MAFPVSGARPLADAAPVNRRTTTLATLGGLAVAMWLAVPGGAPTEAGVQQPAAAVAAASPGAPAQPLHPVPAAAMADAPAAVPAGVTVELCGTGRLPLRTGPGGAETDAFETLPDPLGRWAIQELQGRLLRMLATGDARQRVAAWLLRQPEEADPAAQAAWAAGLLAEARAGGDTQALRWAAAACGHADDATRCRHDLALARVRAEPDNGVHWLEWAQEAASASEQAEAWQGLVRARRWHERPGGLTAVTQAALATLQPVPPAYLRARLARETLGRDTAQAPGGQAWLEQQCAQHRDDCAQVAERMRDDADSAALLQQAAALGRQAGWAEERLQTLAAATQAFHARLPQWPQTPPAALACATAEPLLAHAEAVARHGEVRPLTTDAGVSWQAPGQTHEGVPH